MIFIVLLIMSVTLSGCLTEQLGTDKESPEEKEQDVRRRCPEEGRR